MYLKWILILILIHYLCVCRGVNYEPDERYSWIARMRLLRQDVKDCAKRPGGSVWSCLKMSTMKLFDEIFSYKTIPIWRGIRLVRVVDTDDVFNVSGPKGSLKATPIDAQRDVEGFVDLKQIAMMVTRVLRTHVLQLNVKEVVDAVLNNKDGAPQVHGTPRHRRHRNNMVIAMVFGVTALGAVLVPMGFQFLSVVSGKALLLAKMALLLASINGLKRVANSGVHYGLYQVPGEPYGYGYYDRGDSHHPRSIHNSILPQ